MQIEMDKVQHKIMGVLSTIVDEWDEELEEPITAESLLVENVGFASIDFVQFVVAIEQAFGRKLGFQALLIQNGAYVEDLSVQQFVNFVHAQLSGADPASAEITTEPALAEVEEIEMRQALAEVPEEEKVTAEKIGRFKSMIKPPAPRTGDPSEKNPPAVFILSPPRSGSTLLRVILAGSPQLFVPPELHLLSYNDMAQRKASLNAEHKEHLLEGTIRAMMQLRGWDAEQARAFDAGCEQRALSCKQFYKLMQTTMGRRLLVDKTPVYALHRDILQRAEQDFDKARYIHLTRHPCGMIRSYEESKITRMMPLMEASDFSSRELAEMIWQLIHENILNFAESVPQERFLWVKYEDLVTDPRQQLQRICRFLAIDFHEEMLNPYGDNEKRMADGVDVVSKMSGDLKFHLHQGIDPTAATRWRQFYSEAMLGGGTRGIARRCGFGV